jgi:hypothetical protein
MSEKATCDACGKEVGAATLYKRIGFTSGSRLNKVCHTCYADKLNRDERLRFAKPASRKAKKKDEEAWRPEEHKPPDELRFGG